MVRDMVGVVVRDIVISAGRGRSREDVGDASPRQPFSKMFLMNTIFP